MKVWTALWPLVVFLSIHDVTTSIIQPEEVILIEPNHSSDCPVTKVETAVNTGVANMTKYQVVTSKQLNWFEAFMYCKVRNRRLATVNSKEENDNVVEAIEQALAGLPEDAVLHFWIGGTDLASECQWSWLSTGKPILSYMDYTNWNSWQPDNYGGQENCLQYWKGVNNANEGFDWNDHECSNRYFFICESFQ